MRHNAVDVAARKRLIHQPVHARDIGFNLRDLSIFINGIEHRRDNRERRA